MNSLPTAKYKQVPNDIERKSLKSEADKERSNFSSLEKISREKVRLEKFDKKIYKRKKIKVKNSARSGRRSTHTSCTTQEKRLTGKIL